MTIMKKYIDMGDSLHVRIECSNEIDEGIEVPVYEYYSEKNWPYLIFNAGDLKQELSMYEQYQLVTQIYLMKDAPLRKMAVVLPENLIVKFRENIEINTFFPIRVFNDMFGATEWIRHTDDDINE